jgi:hypothetical protein
MNVPHPTDVRKPDYMDAAELAMKRYEAMRAKKLGTNGVTNRYHFNAIKGRLDKEYNIQDNRNINPTAWFDRLRTGWKREEKTQKKFSKGQKFLLKPKEPAEGEAPAED